MTTTIKQILCPTDFSETSRRAIALATAIAAWYRASLTVQHVHDSMPTSLPGTPAPDEGTSEAEQQQIRDQIPASCLAATAAGIGVNMLVDVGRPATAILDRASQIPADLT